MFDFTGGNFIFRFLPLTLLLYYLFPAGYRKGILLVASCVFYAAFDIRFFALLLAVTLVNYLFAKAGGGRRWLLIFVILLDVLFLGAAKTLSFLFGAAYFPLGVSFYTFKMISFQADRYRGEIADVTLLDTANYFLLFPQVLMGPIMRYRDYVSCEAFTDSALSGRREQTAKILTRIEEGLVFFVAGLGFKVLIANHLASFWNALGTIGYDALSTPLAWLGAAGYSLNLYYDFWGYSLMAAGIGVMLGFPFVENFRHPYAAKGVADFYRRWHITLGTWFRDYVYIPMGGSRLKALRTVFHLFVVWLLTALWHGVGWNFLCWGMVLFLLIVSEKFILSGHTVLFRVVSRLHVWVLIPLTWVIFAIEDVNGLLAYFLRLFPVYGVSDAVYADDFMKYITLYAPYLAAGLLLLFPQVFQVLTAKRRNPFVVLLLAAVFLMSVYSAANAAGNPFMYLQF